MRKYFHRNYNLLIPLVLAGLFLSIALLLSFLYISPNNSGFLTRSFRKKLTQKENNLEVIFSDIQATLKNHDAKFLFDKKQYLNLYREKGILVLIYKNGRLVFWSDNSVSVSDEYNSNNFQDGLIRLSNGWFVKKEVENFPYRIVGLINIRNAYPYENSHITNSYQKSFRIPPEVEISTQPGKFNINSIDGSFLFSLKFPDRFKPGEKLIILLTSLYLLVYIFIILIIYQSYRRIISIFKGKSFWVLLYIFDILLLRFLIFYFRIPDVLYQSPLFGPQYLANSDWFPSLGDLLFNSVTIFAIAVVFHKEVIINSGIFNKPYLLKRALQLSTLVFSFLLFELLTLLLTGVIINSSISFNLDDITTINVYSVIGFFSIALLTLSFVLFTFKISFALSKSFRTPGEFFMIIAGTGIIIFLLMRFLFKEDVLDLMFFLIYAGSFSIIARSGKLNIKFSTTVFFLILFSLYATLILYESNDFKERENRKLIASDLSEERDLVAEFLFEDISEKLQNDSALAIPVKEFLFYGANNYDSIKAYIIDKYFNSYWDKYNFLITVCDDNRSLDIQPDDYVMNCYDYFNKVISDYGTPTQTDGLYFMDYDMTNDNYIGIVDYKAADTSIKIYVEIFSKIIPRGIGYPELLYDQKKIKHTDLSQYSWARYENGELVSRFGKYFYSTSLSHYGKFTDNFIFFNRNGFNHLYYKIDNNKALIISKKNPGILDIAAPFSYIFISFGLLLLIILILFNSPVNIRFFDMSFKKRLQIWITAIILISFIFVGAGSLLYIISLNNSKNHDLLSEKAHSVLVELEHKLSDEDSLTIDMDQYLGDILYKFSLVFFTDINLYNLDGTLLASSRTEIFEQGLISAKMNSEAFNMISNNRKSFFIHDESIGNYKYLSAYIPFRNFDNDLIAYINLPYFARQDELTNEISALLVAFINIYVILIGISIFVALIISNHITKPVQLIREKISRLKLGTTNEKIEWEKKDEIGSLVDEYNRMVDELSRSVNLLARSERESAWREMAKQVAHEIKNPLTPMKLSVQYLQKAWDEKAPDWDERLKRFTDTLTEQIDTLSAIATAFSDFAKMPRSKFEKTDLADVISKSIGLFKNSTGIKFHYEHSGTYFVLADKDQLIRVFNNLIKNAIQAIETPENGLIEISITTENNLHIIHFSDNGRGIPEEQREKVFYPSFTTKTSGMGLGLAMVKNIIENAGGDISFRSEVGKGTVFIISLPVYEEE